MSRLSVRLLELVGILHPPVEAAASTTTSHAYPHLAQTLLRIQTLLKSLVGHSKSHPRLHRSARERVKMLTKCPPKHAKAQ